MTPRRVVYVSTLAAGGPVSHLCDLAPAVAAAGLDVHVVCGHAEVADRLRAAGIAASSAPIDSKWQVGQARRLWERLEGADVVHSQDRRAGLFARPLGRARRAALVHTYHGLPEDIAVMLGREEPPELRLPPARRAWLFGCYFPLESALARFGLVVTPSQAMADFLSARGVPRKRLRVVPSVVDVVRYEPGARHHPLRLAVAANLEPWKGLDVLVDACAGLSVQVDVYGRGSAMGELRRHAARVGAPITFHGQVPDVRDRLLQSDLFVLPSRAENLPIVVLEAMSAALPVVATRVGGVPEQVRHGETGLLVPPNEPAALRAAILSLVHDEATRRRMGAAGAAVAEARFSSDRVVADLLRVYEEACDSSR